LRRRRRDARGHAEDALVDGRWQLRSPMTGSVIEIRVREGERVEAGTVLLVLEAMKMQNELRARVGGVVEAVHVSLGQRVEAASVLLEVKVEA
jgi:biotin carboxyl carrier protein